MKKYFLDKRTLVSGKKNYLNTSNFLQLPSSEDDITIYPSGTWQSFIGLEKPSLSNPTSHTPNYLAGHLIKVEKDIVVSELAMQSLFGSTGNTIAGIYGADLVTGLPTNLIAQTPTQFINSIGQVQSIIFTTPVNLKKGWYYLVSNRNGTVTYTGLPTNLTNQTLIGNLLTVGGGTPINKSIILTLSSVPYSTTLPQIFPTGVIYGGVVPPLISLKIA